MRNTKGLNLLTNDLKQSYSKMKTISIKQPWASLICTPRKDDFIKGIKDIENRTWPVPQKYIGKRILVHASANIDKNAVDFISKIDGELARKIWLNINNNKLNACVFNGKKLVTGAIIGSVEIVGCEINYPSIWAEKTPYAYIGKLIVECQPPIYNWVLANPILFPEPIPAKGKLSFWEYEGISSYEDELTSGKICICNIPIKEGNKYTWGENQIRCRYCGGRWYK